MDTYKLLIEYCAQFKPVLHMLSELIWEYRTGCDRLCSLVRVSQFARVVAAVESAEQAAQVLCSVIRVSF